VADATAESIQKVNQAIQAGGEAYFRYRQIEMLPQIAPVIADALSEAKLVTIANGGGEGAPETTTNNITSVIQTVLAAQLVSRGLLDNSSNNGTAPSASEARLPSSLPPAPTAKK
jgi:flotillin